MTDTYDVLIVGGGHAGAQAASLLRERGFDGSLAIVSAESGYPYERPPLSKAFLVGERTGDDIALRSPRYWRDHEVSLLDSRSVTRVDSIGRSVTLDDGCRLGYRTMIWATGGTPRLLPGTESTPGVHTFRTLDDAVALRDIMRSAPPTVIVGGGFIGLEAAASFRRAGADVTVVEAQPRLLARVTSEPVSTYFSNLHRCEGVELHVSTSVEKITSEDGRLRSVTLTSGHVVSASVMLVGIGLIPNSDVLERAGARVSNGVDVDERCRTSLPDVYAIGDVANFVSPYSAVPSRVRLESVPNTSAHARIAVADIMNSPAPAQPVPWFWSHQYETKLQTAGLIHGYDGRIVRGDVDSGKFSVVYLHGNRLLGVDAVNHTGDFLGAKTLLGTGAEIRMDPERIANERLKLAECVAAAQPVP